MPNLNLNPLLIAFLHVTIQMGLGKQFCASVFNTLKRCTKDEKSFPYCPG